MGKNQMSLKTPGILLSRKPILFEETSRQITAEVNRTITGPYSFHILGKFCRKSLHPALDAIGEIDPGTPCRGRTGLYAVRRPAHQRSMGTRRRRRPFR